MKSRAVTVVYGILAYAPYSIYEKDFAKVCIQLKGMNPINYSGNDIAMTTDKPKRRTYSEYTPSPNRNKTFLSAQNLDLKFIFSFISVYRRRKNQR